MDLTSLTYLWGSLALPRRVLDLCLTHQSSHDLERLEHLGRLEHLERLERLERPACREVRRPRFHLAL